MGLRDTLPRCLRWEGPIFFSTLTEGEALQAVHALMSSALESSGHSFSGPGFPPQRLQSLLLHCMSTECPKLAQAAAQGQTSTASAEPAHPGNTLLNSQRKTVQMGLALMYSLHQHAAQNGDLFLFNQLVQVCAVASLRSLPHVQLQIMDFPVRSNMNASICHINAYCRKGGVHPRRCSVFNYPKQ